MKQIALSEIKDDLSRFLHEAESEQIVITRHGKPAGVLVGFGSEDDWLDYRLEHDPRFLQRISSARASIQAGRGVRMEDLNAALKETEAPNHAMQQTGSAVTTPAAPSGRGRRRARSAGS
jgi:prevent-host-death family protein